MATPGAPANITPGRILILRIASLLDKLLWPIMFFLARIRIHGLKKTLLFSLNIKPKENRSAFLIKEPKSLRKIVTYPDPNELSISEANTLPLRMGR